MKINHREHSGTEDGATLLTIRHWRDYEAFMKAYRKPHIAVRDIAGPSSNPSATYWEVAFVNGDKSHSMMFGMPDQQEAIDLAKFIHAAAHGRGPILVYVSMEDRKKILDEQDAETLTHLTNSRGLCASVPSVVNPVGARHE